MAQLFLNSPLVPGTKKIEAGEITQRDSFRAIIRKYRIKLVYDEMAGLGIIKEHNRVTVVSHFDGRNNSGVNASVHNAFWSRKNTRFFRSHDWRLPFIAISGKSRDELWIINGFTSLIKVPVLLTLMLSPKNIQIAFYLHETSYMLNWIAARNLCNKAASRVARHLMVRSNALVWSASPIGEQVLQSFWRARLSNIFFVGEVIDYFPKLRQGAKKKNGKFDIVGAGLPNHRKGFDRFLSIARLITNDFPGQFSFTWYSKGMNPVPHEFRDAVTWAPYAEDFQKEVAAYDLHLMCSRDDPFPLVSLEALSSGLTVIAFPNTGPFFLGPPIIGTKDVKDCVKVLGEFANGVREPLRRKVNQDLAKEYSLEMFWTRAVVLNRTKPAKLRSPQKFIAQLRNFIVLRVRPLLVKLRVRKSLKILSRSRKRVETSHSYKRVSLVGRSPNLLGSNWGSEIDKSDEVIRINHRGNELFSNDVGKKTSVVYISPAYNSEKLINEIRVVRPYPFSSRRRAIARLKAGPFGPDGVESLLFWEMSASAQKVIRGLYPNYKRYWPTTGVAAVIVTLLERGDIKLPIKVFGMSLYSESDSITLHKFDGSTTPLDGKHDFHLEREFLRGLERLGLINLQTRNAR